MDDRDRYQPTQQRVERTSSQRSDRSARDESFYGLDDWERRADDFGRGPTHTQRGMGREFGQTDGGGSPDRGGRTIDPRRGDTPDRARPAPTRSDAERTRALGERDRGLQGNYGEDGRFFGFDRPPALRFRAPKNYKRSDERIREDVNERLTRQHQLDPSDIEVAVSNAEVTLRGMVQSRQEKFRAEEIAAAVSGVDEVHNELRVRRDQR
jgi:hypothetical protein